MQTDSVTEPMAKDNSCAICLDALLAPGLSCQRLGCGHIYHEQCILTMRRLSLNTNECPICQCPSQDVAPLDRLYEDALRHYQRNLFTECVRICEEVLLVDEGQGRPRPFSLNSATMVWGFVMMSRQRVCSRSKFTRLHYSARQTSNRAFPNKSTFAAGCLTQDATASNSSVQSINEQPQSGQHDRRHETELQSLRHITWQQQTGKQACRRASASRLDADVLEPSTAALASVEKAARSGNN